MTDDTHDGSAPGAGPGDTKGDHTRACKAASRGKEKLREIQGIFSSIRDELRGDRFWRYQRQVSPGLQEYIEALSFAHYLEYGKLVSFEEVQKTLSDEQGLPVCCLVCNPQHWAHFLLEVFSTSTRGLSTRIIRPYWRTHALRNLCHLP